MTLLEKLRTRALESDKICPLLLRAEMLKGAFLEASLVGQTSYQMNYVPVAEAQQIELSFNKHLGLDLSMDIRESHTERGTTVCILFFW